MALYRRARSTRLLVVTLVMLSLITITIDYREGRSGPFEAAGRAALTVISPLQAGVSRVFHPIGAFFGAIEHLVSLQSENGRLKAEIDRLKAQQAQTALVRRQRAELLALLKLQQQLSVSGPAARVIGESVSNFEWTAQLDKGSSSGIKVDDPVITGDGLVGHVVEVTPNTSVVQLIIDPRAAVAGRLAVSGETGLVVGQRNKDLQMQLVDPNTVVAPGEQVVTSGYQSGLYPPDVPIGVVSHVYHDQTKLAEVVNVRPAVDFSALEFVLVVTRR
jgi:rod shape-determining protein MreC